MSERDEFKEADDAVGVAVLAPIQSSKPKSQQSLGSSMASYREGLVERYHKGAGSLVDRLRQEGKTDAESLLVSLIDEVIRETDHLLGNELIATESGDLRDASIISFKRAEVLEKAIKAVQAKHQVEKESGVDLDSPSMIVVFRFFMAKVRESFKRMNVPDEQSDIFFRTLGEEMENWKKELREQLTSLKGR